MRTIPEILKAAGGAKGISEASGGTITKDAVYKWPTIGIPDRHWGLLIDLTETTPEELYRANATARGSSEGAAA